MDAARIAGRRGSRRSETNCATRVAERLADYALQKWHDKFGGNATAGQRVGRVGHLRGPAPASMQLERAASAPAAVGARAGRRGSPWSSPSPRRPTSCLPHERRRRRSRAPTPWRRRRRRRPSSGRTRAARSRRRVAAGRSKQQIAAEPGGSPSSSSVFVSPGGKLQCHFLIHRGQPSSWAARRASSSRGTLAELIRPFFARIGEDKACVDRRPGILRVGPVPCFKGWQLRPFGPVDALQCVDSAPELEIYSAGSSDLLCSHCSHTAESDGCKSERRPDHRSCLCFCRRSLQPVEVRLYLVLVGSHTDSTETSCPPLLCGLCPLRWRQPLELWRHKIFQNLGKRKPRKAATAAEATSKALEGPKGHGLQPEFLPKPMFDPARRFFATTPRGSRLSYCWDGPLRGTRPVPLCRVVSAHAIGRANEDE